MVVIAVIEVIGVISANRITLAIGRRVVRKLR